MSAREAALDAEAVAETLRGRLPGPWDLYLERVRRFEIHLNQDRVEMRRGPIELVAAALRLFRPAGDRLGIGTATTSDLSPEGIDRAVRAAELAAPFARSPATTVEFPSARLSDDGAGLELVDRRLWERPEEAIDAAAHGLLEAVDRRGGVMPSFGSIRAALNESSVANSEGASGRFAHTIVDLEFAVKATGGPEGRPPGEYWINRRTRRLPTDGSAEEVRGWCQRAQDVRRAVPPGPGTARVILPPELLADVLPTILGFRLSGTAAVRKIAPSAGDAIAWEGLSVDDDGRRPGAVGSAPHDDEATPQRRTRLIDRGRFVGPIVDLVHAAALSQPPTGNGHRGGPEFPVLANVLAGLGTSPTTLAIAPGAGGTDAELIEQAREGLWLDQLGYAFPDGISSAFGGEIRLGYRIRDGKLAEPVRGGTVGGFTFGPAATPPLLTALRALGSRPTTAGRISTPPMLAEGFPVVG